MSLKILSKVLFCAGFAVYAGAIFMCAHGYTSSIKKHQDELTEKVNAIADINRDGSISYEERKYVYSALGKTADKNDKNWEGLSISKLEEFIQREEHMKNYLDKNKK